MHISKKTTHYIILFAVAFVAMGIAHFLLYGVPYGYGISQIVSGMIIITWGITVERRIIDKITRRIMIVTASMLMLYFLLQISKYNLFDTMPNARRILWYAFYMPMTAIPLLMFFLALLMNTTKNDRPSKLWNALIIPCTMMIIGFLTNDVHELAFAFKDLEKEEYSYYILYFMYITWSVILTITTICLMIKKCGILPRKKYILIPITPIVLGVGYLIISMILGGIRINGVTFYEIGEMYAFIIVGFIEGCIQIGLIQANTGYDNLFDITSVIAQIDDMNGTPVYVANKDVVLDEKFRKMAIINPVNINRDIRLSGRSVSGGVCYWLDNFKNINRINDDIVEVTRQINARNELMQMENDLLEERAKLDAQNHLYDRIANSVREQTQLILDTLDGENISDKELSYISVLNAYIKRRSNLELIEQQYVDVEELKLAIKESLTYIDLCGVETFITGGADGEADKKVVINCYEAMEKIFEAIIYKANALAVNMAVEAKELVVRMTIESNEYINFPASKLFKITREDCDFVIKITLPIEGGETA